MKFGFQQTVIILGALSGMNGCVLPVRQSMPATVFECIVVNTETNDPVDGALVSLVYEGPDKQIEQIGPFLSNSRGIATVRVSKKGYWMSGPTAFFTAGYTRYVAVKASGFEPSFKMENFERGLLEKLSPIRIPLKPFRNTFGGVIVKEFSQDGQWHRLILSVIDGPNTGEIVSIKIIPGKLINPSVGKKLYLKQSISSILSENEKYRIIANNPDLILREGFPNEPFDPLQ